MTNAELAKLVVDPLAEVGYSIDQMYIDHRLSSRVQHCRCVIRKN